jgi:hypothetical protein
MYLLKCVYLLVLITSFVISLFQPCALLDFKFIPKRLKTTFINEFDNYLEIVQDLKFRRRKNKDFGVEDFSAEEEE